MKDVASQVKAEEVTAEVAVVASQVGLPGLSSECVQKLSSTRNLKACALATLAKCDGQLRSMNRRHEESHPGSSACIGGSDPDAKYALEVLSQLVTLIDSAVRHHRATTNLMKQEAAEFPQWGAVVEEAVALCWRAVLPLLQHHRREQVVKGAIMASIAALDAIQSTSVRVLQRLHHEAAACEALEDALGKAVMHIKELHWH